MAYDNYIYLDFLRAIFPIDKPFVGFDFFCPCSTEMLVLNSNSDIHGLIRRYKEERINIPPAFERRPVFLYTEDAIDLDNDHVFSFGNEDERTPLLLLSLQFDKRLFLKYVNSYSHELTEHIKNLINTYLKYAQDEYRVFLDFSENDSIVAFCLKDFVTTELLINNIKEMVKLENEIISYNFNCLFPKPSVLNESVRSMNKYQRIINASLSSWPQITKLFNFENVFTYGLTNSLPCSISMNVSVESNVTCASQRLIKDNTGSFDMSLYVKLNRILSQISNSAAELIMLLNGIGVSDERKHTLIEQISAQKNSIYSLGNELLYAEINNHTYVVSGLLFPVFKLYQTKTAEYKAYFEECSKQGHLEYAEHYVNEFLDDTALIIKIMHNIFSIAGQNTNKNVDHTKDIYKALSKIVFAFEGIIQFCADRLSVELLNENNRKKKCNRQILMVPQNDVLTKKYLFYNHSNPFNSVYCFTLNIDRQTGFSGTVFQLLCESTHDFCTHLRKKRFELFSSALISSALRWAVEEYINNPFEAIVRNVTTEPLYIGEVAEHTKLLLNGLDEKSIAALRCKYSNKLRKTMQEIMLAVGKSYTGSGSVSSVRRYNDYWQNAIIMSSELLKWKNYDTEQIALYMEDEGLPEYFGIDENQINIDYTLLFREILYDNIRRTVAESLYEIVLALANDIISMHGNIREALRIKVGYSNSSIITDSIIRNIKYNIKNHLDNNKHYELLAIFDRVYGDVYANKILDLDYASYAKILSETEMIYHQGFANGTLIRIAVVQKVCYGRSDFSEFNKFLTQEQFDELNRRVEILQYYPEMDFVEQYANLCAKSMDSKVNKFAASNGDPLTRLSVLSNSGNCKIDDVIHFYQYLIKKGS